MHLARNFVVALLMTVATTAIFGIGYPLMVTAAAQLLFPEKANGQLLERDGQLVGSRLIGQPFSSPGYFRSRPSAAGTGYDASNSGATNLGPTNKKLVDAVAAQVAIAKKENPGVRVPIDLVTSSASGLDPHVSPAAAFFQVPRVARERRVGESDVRQLVTAYLEGPQLGILGESRVNVLMLNLALDARWPMRR
jgi:potassium-transporting ATPase KdpC subunit